MQRNINKNFENVFLVSHGFFFFVPPSPLDARKNTKKYIYIFGF